MGAYAMHQNHIPQQVGHTFRHQRDLCSKRYDLLSKREDDVGKGAAAYATRSRMVFGKLAELAEGRYAQLVSIKIKQKI